MVAAGRGSRFGGLKQFFLVGKEPMWRRAALALRAAGCRRVVIAVPRGFVKRLRRRFRRQGWMAFCEGGSTRQESVAAGLRALKSGNHSRELILVHDAARPFASAALVRRVLLAARAYGAACPLLPLSDTVKECRNGVIRRTLDRSRIFLAQTPQGFRRDILEEAHRRFRGAAATDDSCLVERLGKKVRAVPGDPANRKITTRADLP